MSPPRGHPPGSAPDTGRLKAAAVDLPSALLLRPAGPAHPPQAPPTYRRSRPPARRLRPPALETALSGLRSAWPPGGGPGFEGKPPPAPPTGLAVTRALGRCSPLRPACRAGPWRAKRPLLGRVPPAHSPPRPAVGAAPSAARGTPLRSSRRAALRARTWRQPPAPGWPRRSVLFICCFNLLRFFTSLFREGAAAASSCRLSVSRAGWGPGARRRSRGGGGGRPVGAAPASYCKL